MTDTIKAMRQCPKFEGCPAPICPLDPEWNLRVYRKGEPICFYLLEYVKPDAEAQFQGCIGVQIYAAIEKHLDAISHRYAPLSRALERAKRTGSRMRTSLAARTTNQEPPLDGRWNSRDRPTAVAQEDEARNHPGR